MKILKKISNKLNISYGTVRWHLSNIKKLYNIHKTIELLLIFNNNNNNEYIKFKISSQTKKVLELFMHGHTYEQISKTLDISISGVQRHIERTMIQNECNSTLELIVKYKTYHNI